MREIVLNHAADFQGWRDKARSLLIENVPPEDVVWLAGSDTSDLFGGEEASDSISLEVGTRVLSRSASKKQFQVPRAYISLARYVVCHSDPARFALLYRLLWRLNQGEPDLLQNPSDEDVYRLDRLHRAVSRERHKMTAFVRFRRLRRRHDSAESSTDEHYLAWFEPEHHILRLTSDFFTKRFSNMSWSIVTPTESAHWNGSVLVFSGGGTRDSLDDAENMEGLWRTYFANIFNPARLRVKAMQSEMPVKYWKNLPEAPLIASMIHESDARTQQMIDQPATRPSKYSHKAEHVSNKRHTSISGNVIKTLTELADGLEQCKKCAHALMATQAVRGCLASTIRGHESRSFASVLERYNVARNNGSRGAVMLVGEQPGDQEDLVGQPFVGPSGQLLRELLTELKLNLDDVYMTNAVKHFNYFVKGKRRIHRRPPDSAISHCQPWLMDEMRLLQPRCIVALGSTAAKSLLARSVRISEVRGQWQTLTTGTPLIVTAHPASVLRIANQQRRLQARELLKRDLELAFSGIPAVAQPI